MKAIKLFARLVLESDRGTLSSLSSSSIGEKMKVILRILPSTVPASILLWPFKPFEFFIDWGTRA